MASFLNVSLPWSLVNSLNSRICQSRLDGVRMSRPLAFILGVVLLAGLGVAAPVSAQPADASAAKRPMMLVDLLSILGVLDP